MAALDPLAPLRAHGGRRRTTGLDDAVIERFAASPGSPVHGCFPFIKR